MTALIDPFGFQLIASVESVPVTYAPRLLIVLIASVESVPVAEVVTTVAHAAVEIELVPRAEVPLAIVCGTVALAFGKVNVLADEAGPATVKNAFAVPPLALGSVPVTFAVRSIVEAAISALTMEELVTVCVDPAKWAIPAPGDEAFTTLAVTTPLSCNRQVVLVTVQSIRCPVVGTATKPLMVFVVVAPLPIIVCAAAEPFASVSVPAALLSVPRAGAAVRAGVLPARICPAAPVIAHVPVVVIVPPLRPVPQITLVTVPDPPAATT